MTWHQITFFTESVLRHTKSLQVKTVIKSPCKVSLSAQKCHHGTNGCWGKCRAVPGCRCIYNRGLTLRLKEHLHIAGQFFFFLLPLPLVYRCPSGVHVFGLLATALVTDVIQLATGYHAPFFLTVCQPNYTAPGVSCDNNAYITQDICMGKDQYAIMSAR